MSCPVGRAYDPQHPCCRSCEAQLGQCKSKPKRRAKAKPIVRTWHNGSQLFSTQYLYSMNHWHGRPLTVYLAYKADWKKVLLGTWALWGKAAGRRSLHVQRIVTSESHLIKDSIDNLNAALKPLKDVLEGEKVLLDDSDKNVEPSISQEIGPEQMVVITVKDL